MYFDKVQHGTVTMYALLDCEHANTLQTLQSSLAVLLQEGNGDVKQEPFMSLWKQVRWVNSQENGCFLKGPDMLKVTHFEQPCYHKSQLPDQTAYVGVHLCTRPWYVLWDSIGPHLSSVHVNSCAHTPTLFPTVCYLLDHVLFWAVLTNSYFEEGTIWCQSSMHTIWQLLLDW